MPEKSSTSIAVTPGFLLFLLFLGLKLTGHIAWSWWWVTAPLWIPFAIVMVIFLSIVVIAYIFHQ